MSIIDKLKKDIESVTGLPFIYGAQGDVNRALDKAPLPCVFAYLIRSGQVVSDHGTIFERLSIALFFVNKTEMDFESLENERIIDKMKRYAFLWRASHYRETDCGFEIDAVDSSSRVYDEIADAIVTGYGISVTIRDTDGVGLCDLEAGSEFQTENSICGC